MATISGAVADINTLQRLPGAKIKFEQFIGPFLSFQYVTYSNANGDYTATVPAGNYIVTVERQNYISRIWNPFGVPEGTSSGGFGLYRIGDDQEGFVIKYGEVIPGSMSFALLNFDANIKAAINQQLQANGWPQADSVIYLGDNRVEVIVKRPAGLSALGTEAFVAPWIIAAGILAVLGIVGVISFLLWQISVENRKTTEVRVQGAKDLTDAYLKQCESLTGEEKLRCLQLTVQAQNQFLEGTKPPAGPLGDLSSLLGNVVLLVGVSAAAFIGIQLFQTFMASRREPEEKPYRRYEVSSITEKRRGK